MGSSEERPWHGCCLISAMMLPSVPMLLRLFAALRSARATDEGVVPGARRGPSPVLADAEINLGLAPFEDARMRLVLEEGIAGVV
jgi:hypothetical protein